jgi:hypothetical protein
MKIFIYNTQGYFLVLPIMVIINVIVGVYILIKFYIYALNIRFESLI